MLNIPSTVDDPNYRYKMPKLVSKIEGRGNGIRTKIVNMADIARSLKRPPAYPTKFFGCELGALSKWEDKEERSIVNGAHQQNDLQKLMDKFIQMYVLCPSCELPEIDIVVKKERVSCKCNACGHIGALDNNHKITTYISKNPPGGVESTMGSKSKKERKEKEKERSSENNANINPIHSDEKCSKHKQKKSSKKGSKKSANEVDILEKDVLTFDSPEISDVIERLTNFIIRNSEKMTPDDFFSELRVLQVSQDFDEHMRLLVLLASFFGLNDVIDPTSFKLRIPYISRVIEGSLRSTSIISVFETYCVEKNPSTLLTYPYLLQQLYDADILSEKSILRYYQKEAPTPWNSGCSTQDTFEKAKKSCEPFINWLLDGSVDGSEQSDEYEEDINSDIDGDDSLSPNKNPNIKVKSLNLTEIADGNEADFPDSESEVDSSLTKEDQTPSKDGDSDIDIDNI
ncbi:translation initiation factor eIF Tif5p [Cryptosporidium bovis]|uniref:translation initiation factor eIF Tif5p n=1 Tax=Cryptosporidium bovis TaxID=310047 RepID=UPI00351A3343|nr:translation initiation factor eIF Tif5p [Cryptosporidium bovis]